MTTPPHDPGMEREQKRKAMYLVLSQAKEWPLFLNDLCQYAAATTEAQVRCGRLDMICYILDSVYPREEI